MKKLFSFSLFTMAAVLCLAMAALTGCGGSSGGGDGDAVGSWRCTNFEGSANSGFYWHFNSDGTFSLNQSATDTSSARYGTYSVSGNRITGDGVNTGVGTFQIDFAMDGDYFSGDFFEHWNGGKHVPIEAVRD